MKPLEALPGVYTGIGSRKAPAAILTLMEAIGGRLANRGWILWTGDADGPDARFTRAVVRANGTAIVYSVGRLWPTVPAIVLGERYHPAWDVCDWPARLLLSRDVHQVLGPKCDQPSDFVLCWTPDGAISGAQTSRRTGGTGQAIRVASAYGVPVYNLQREDHRALWQEFAR